MCDCDTHQLGSPVSSTSSLLHYCNAYKLISYKMAGQFSCFGCLLTLFTEELLTAAKTLVDSYPNDLDSSFVDELCHFAKFADIFKDDEPGNISTELFLYELIIDAGGLMIQCIPWQSPPTGIFLATGLAATISMVNITWLNCMFNFKSVFIARQHIDARY